VRLTASPNAPVELRDSGAASVIVLISCVRDSSGNDLSVEDSAHRLRSC
jgi:hypothetical protein